MAKTRTPQTPAADEDLAQYYERRHLANVRRLKRRVSDKYLDVIKKLFKGKRLPGETGPVFRVDDVPGMKSRLDAVLAEFQTELHVTLANGIRESWALSGEKMTVLVNRHYDTSALPENVIKVLFDPNDAALKAFIDRKMNGMNLSDRVWRYTNQFRANIEQTLYEGISRGIPATEISRNLMPYLQNPDRLFRRVRDARGRLVLSKSARAFHPGRGVYRSSYLNAMRLARTETNMAYRMSDMNHFRRIPFVLGYDVKLSPNHPRYDICDALAGRYPKTFTFRGWHAQCLCYVVPVMASDEEFDRYQKAVMAGTEADFKFSEIPMNSNVDRWVARNSPRIENWKRLPLFMTDNKLNIIPTLEGTAMRAKNIMTRAGFSIYNVELGPGIQQPMLDKWVTQLDKLTSEYDVSAGVPYPDRTLLSFVSDRMPGTAGYVMPAMYQGRYERGMIELNYGHRVPDYGKRNNIGGFDRWFSAVDPQNNDLATVTHEFGHTINVHGYVRTPGVPQAYKDFWNEIADINDQYRREILTSTNPESVFLGRYAGVNLSEFMAEGFTEYKLRATPSKYAAMIGETIDRYFKKK